MNRIYECLFIVKPDATEEEIDAFIEGLTKNLATAGGTVDKVEKWGKRRLAYRVEKNREGYYVLLQFTAGPQTVREFERRMRVADMVLKYLTVRIDELLKRLDKKKKDREKRAQRKPQSVAPQPSLAQQMLGGAVEGAHPLPGAPVPGAPVPGSPAPGAPVAVSPGAPALPIPGAPASAPAVPVPAEPPQES